MIKRLLKEMLKYLKKETVLVFTLLAAFISAVFNPPSAQYLEFIDTKVLLCLFCLMITIAGFKKLGAFEKAASYVAGRSRNMRGLALGIVLLTFFSAMVVTNDVALITLVPFTLVLLDKLGRNEYAITVIVLQTIGANIGSSLTPVGNPQNLYIYSFYKISTGEFFMTLLPVVFMGGVLLGVSTLMIDKRPLVSRLSTVGNSGERENPSSYNVLKGLSGHPEAATNESGRFAAIRSFLCIKGKPAAFTILFTLSVLSVFNLVPVEWVAGILALSILILDYRLFREVDYSLLITFIGFFIFVGNLSALPAVNAFLSELLSKGVFIVSLLTSQIISNVPAAVLLSGFTSDYRALLLGVNVGGMGTHGEITNRYLF